MESAREILREVKREREENSLEIAKGRENENEMEGRKNDCVNCDASATSWCEERQENSK